MTKNDYNSQCRWYSIPIICLLYYILFYRLQSRCVSCCRTHELLRILDALLVDEGEVVTRWLVFLGWNALAMMGISTWGNILFDILVLFILIEYVMFGIMSEMSSYKPNC